MHSASISAASTRGRLSVCMRRKLDRSPTSMMYRRSDLPVSLSNSLQTKPDDQSLPAGGLAQSRQTTNVLAGEARVSPDSRPLG